MPLVVFPAKGRLPASAAYSRDNLDCGTVNLKPESNVALHKRGEDQKNHRKYLNDLHISLAKVLASYD